MTFDNSVEQLQLEEQDLSIFEVLTFFIRWSNNKYFRITLI
jgi:hypothetical protein